jgi:hypothetical protein
MPRVQYGHRYGLARAAMLADRPSCWLPGCRNEATEADHVPPFALHDHRDGTGCCELRPMCSTHARQQGGRLGRGAQLERLRHIGAPPAVPEPEGIGADDERWRVPWLADLLELPPEATWPRLMTVPHPRAVGSYGLDAEGWSAERNRSPWRWWQRLGARRILEHDDDGQLCWEGWLLTVSRQSGKTRLLRDLCGWRLERRDLLGIAGDNLVLSIARDVSIMREMMRPALAFAATSAEHTSRLANGTEEVGYCDGSRWLGRSERSGYGYSVGLATVDECWDIAPLVVDDMLVPTMVEMEQTQVGLTSTAHRRATPLFVGRRASAFAQLHDPLDCDLLCEWSAAPSADAHDRSAWRQASPHWTPKREREVARALGRAEAGETIDSTESDPMAAFDCQWLNRWPARRQQAGKGELLLDLDLWDSLQVHEPEVTGPYVIAVEDNLGHGAAIAAALRCTDERVEVGGWCCDDWAEAMSWVAQLAEYRPGSRLLVGAALLEHVPRGLGVARVERSGLTETRLGLVLLRELLAARRVIHDDTPELDAQLAACRVTPAPSGGLSLIPGPRSDLARSAVWALLAIERRRPAPQID